MLNRRQLAWFAMALGLALGGCNCGAAKPTVVAHPKNLGESCTKDSECISTLCAKVPGLFAPTDTCLAPCGLSCPDPQRCVDIGIHNNNETFACAPDTGKLCSACTTDDSCGYPGDVCLQSGDVTACGRDCTGDGKCPTGYKCQAGKRPNGLSSGLQCVPTTGTCECTEATRGAKRACSKTNALGTCQGSETCDPGQGFTGCDARTPVPETCDGVDNDCNGKVDDGLAMKSCGSGPCEVTVYSCADGGAATCTPDMTKATAETCDGVDNNCNGVVDDGLAPITCGSGPCLVTVAACVDGGAATCHPDLTKATAEICDGIDNDCNGHIDDGFVTSNDVNNCGGCGTVCPSQNGVPACHSSVCSITCNTHFDNCNHLPADGCEASLLTDPNNCGTCGTICSFGSGTGTCTGGHCVLTGCAPGHVDLNHDPSDGCEYACTVRSTFDEPDLGFVDANCDGIDGEVARGVFVDKVGGNDTTGDGTMAHPFKTVQKGIDQAFAQSLRDVYVSQGTYSPTASLQLKDGVNVYGGYQAASGWSRSFGNTVTLSGSVTPVVGASVNDVKLQLMNVLGQGAQTGSAVAVKLTDSLNVTFEAVLVQAGSGGDGLDGANGLAGADGNVGSPGAAGHEDDQDFGTGICGNCSGPFSSFPSCSAPAGGAAGTNTCPNLNASANPVNPNGGAGGNSGYETASGDLGHASPGGAPGGQANVSGQGTAPAPGVCNGHNGANDNTAVTDGSGGASVGTVTGGIYTAADGSVGSDGTPGRGGGGGGGGGGGPSGLCRSWGAAGGGGGAGGCGGVHATAGKGGGASIGVWLQNSSLTVLSGNIIGGQGGKGGAGGVGGAAGQGALGGDSTYGGNGQQDASRGGVGGKGGNGSRGGHAGGGGGGPSIAVVKLSATLTLDTSSAATPGHGGQGGLGGDGNRAASGLEQGQY